MGTKGKTMPKKYSVEKTQRKLISSYSITDGFSLHFTETFKNFLSDNGTQ